MTDNDGPTVIWAGTYSEKGGRGLYPLIPLESGAWTIGNPFDAARNASFGARSAEQGLYYLVDEDGGSLGAYRFENEWTCLSRVSTGGSEPCYVALNPYNAQLAVANYGSGSIALFALDPDGMLPAAPPELRPHAGRGADPERQEGPHAHCACFSPDGRWMYHVDLGTDEILAFPLDQFPGRHRLAFTAHGGSGPRHLLFHPRGSPAFLIGELASTVEVLNWSGDRFTSLQRLSTLPDDWRGDSLGGHIGMNARGDRLYVTNRGHDSIGVFEFDGERLSLLQHVSSGGSSPRFFLLLDDRNLMLVANEEGGNVTGFRVAENGTLARIGIDIPIPGPAFLFEASPA